MKHLTVLFFLALALSAGAMNRDTVAPKAFPVQFDTVAVHEYVDLNTRPFRVAKVYQLEEFILLPDGQRLTTKRRFWRREDGTEYQD